MWKGIKSFFKSIFSNKLFQKIVGIIVAVVTFLIGLAILLSKLFNFKTKEEKEFDDKVDTATGEVDELVKGNEDLIKDSKVVVDDNDSKLVDIKKEQKDRENDIDDLIN